MTLILMLVALDYRDPGCSLSLLELTVKATFIQTELNMLTWLCTSCHNVVGNTPASDRMGYAQTNVFIWPDTPIGGLLAYNFKVKIYAAE